MQQGERAIALWRSRQRVEVRVGTRKRVTYVGSEGRRTEGALNDDLSNCMTLTYVTFPKKVERLTGDDLLT